jgi:Zn-dependent protease with chaperone function
MVQANYFDGRSTRVRIVDLSIEGEDLLVAGEDVNFRVAFARVKVDERLGRAARRLRFEDGAFCEVRDLEALDGLLALTSYREGQVDRWQRSLQTVLLSLVACLALGFFGYKYALPWAAARGARQLPPAVGKSLTVHALKALDGTLLKPTTLESARQEELTAKFRSLRLPQGDKPHTPLLFRDSPQLGANAFTLPDGTIVLLDGLITTIGDDNQIMAVLAHELGHAYGRHGLQLLIQTSVVGAFLTLYAGDVSHLLAAAPAALLQARYSQDLEREADDYGASVMTINGLSPGLLADALQKLLKAHHDATHEGYLSSHPPTDERMRHLRELAHKSHRAD